MSWHAANSAIIAEVRRRLIDDAGRFDGVTTIGVDEHLRGSALGFRNLTNYVARSLLEAGGFRPRLHPRL